MRVEALESRQMMAADSIGFTPLNTAGFLLGSVTVTPVFFESNGSIDPQTQNWSPNEITQTLAKIEQGLNWWSDLLETKTLVHDLTFEFDNIYATTPVQTGYEPIDRTSQTFQNYVGDFLTDRGYGDAPSIERAVQLFNDAQRVKKGTDWAFTIFVVDSSDDGDGFFGGNTQFSGAFAFPGGLFIVSPSGRPDSTFAHEMGHIFWARDEYPGGGSWTDRRGYYNAQNFNAADNETPGFQQELSIMSGGQVLKDAYENLTTAESTLEMMGWRDTDGDQVFDVLDVPLNLEAVGYSDVAQNQYRLTGSASAVPLMNQNSAGIQSDMTLGRVREIQYRLDNLSWVAAAQFDSPVVDFDLTVPINQAYSTIQWRAIDTATGVTSEIMQGPSGGHAFSAGVGGYSYVDENQNASYDAGEMALAETLVTVLDASGSPLFSGDVIAENLADGDLAGNTPGVTLFADGPNLDGRVAVFDARTNGNAKNLQAFDSQSGSWFDRWGADRRELEAMFSQQVAEVTVSFDGLNTGGYGVRDGSYARIEAYDDQGALITRVTSDMVLNGQSSSLTLSVPTASIASVRIFGHAETEITVTSIDFGFQDQFTTDENGAWPAIALPGGNYRFDLQATNLIYQWGGPIDVNVPAGGVFVVDAAAQRVDSPRHNAAFPTEVNGRDGATALDALTIINDISRLGARTLGADETTGDDIDVNNDGMVTALDALLVINELKDSEGEGEATFHLMQANTGASARLSGFDSSNTGSSSPLASDVFFSELEMFNSAGRTQGIESSPAELTDTEFTVLEFSASRRRDDSSNQASRSEKTGENPSDRQKFPQLEDSFRFSNGSNSTDL